MTQRHAAATDIAPLPEALHPWRTWLQWFEPDLIPAVADILRRLTPLFSALRGACPTDNAEFDGIGNIMRKGPYERLLLSEWLLADELPDEFLRRAAQAEHLFLTPYQRPRREESSIIALFDSGPLQFGAARLAHIALAILLARRAQRNGCRFMWGVLQKPQAPYPFLEAPHLSHLLESRTFRAASREHMDAWRKLLAPYPAGQRELWLIGAGASLPAGAATASGITHRVTVTPGMTTRELTVQLHAKGTTRDTTLPLPPDNLAARLLSGQIRNPVTRHKKLRWRLALSAPVIGVDGTYVAIRLLDEPAMLLLRVPHNKGGKASAKHRRLYFPTGHQILTMNVRGKSAGAVMSYGENLTFWQIPAFAPFKKPPADILQITPGMANLLPSIWLNCVHDSRWRLYLLDHANRLVYAGTPSGQSATAIVPVAQDVFAIAQMHQHVMVYIQRHAEGTRVYMINGGTLMLSARLNEHTPPDATALFAYRSGKSFMPQQLFYPCAIRVARLPDETWHVHYPSAGQTLHSELTLPAGWHAAGLYYPDPQADAGEAPVLLAINRNKTAVGSYQDGGLRVLYTAPSPITRKTFTPSCGLLALLTEDKSLIVYSVHQECVLLTTGQDTGEDDA